MKQWYFIHTYSGHENKVVESLAAQIDRLQITQHTNQDLPFVYRCQHSRIGSQIDAPMAAEAPVFRRHHRVLDDARDARQRHPGSPHPREREPAHQIGF